MLTRPLAVAIAFAAGIAIAPAGIPAEASWIAAIALAVIAARRREVVLVAALAAGAGHGAPSPGTLAGIDDRGLDRITGDVLGPITRTHRGTGARLATADAVIWVWAEAALVPGERIAVTGFLTGPRGSRGPGLPDPDALGLARGARYEITAKSIEHLADEPDWIALGWRAAAAAQARGVAAIDAAGGDPTGASALRGLALGDRASVPAELDARWRAAGIYHVLSVSGLHLFIVAMLLFWLLRRAIAASPWGGRLHPAAWAAPPTLIVAIAYTAITGAQLATLRSLIVVAITLVAAMLARPVRLVDALGVAALVILAWRPSDLFDPGFQLSFIAALTLALRPVPPAPAAGVVRWILDRLRQGLAASTWIAITTAPITAYHFQQVAIGGIAGNVLFTVFLEVLALPLALAGLVLGCDPLVWLATWIVALVDRGTGVFAEVAPIGRVAIAGPFVLVVLVILSVLLARRRTRTRVDVAVWIALCVAWSLGRSSPPAGALRVTFVDVGQGDAAIVELPDGAVWLVDAGGLANARDLTAASAPGRTVTRVLAAYGHSKIDVAILSHPHPDHYLGLAALDVPIDELWIAPEPEHAMGPELAKIVAGLTARGTRVIAPPLGVARTQAEVELVTWAPRYDGGLAADPVRGVNDNSLVVAVRYRDRTLLFTGDLEAEGEEALAAAGIGHVDVVKVPHHGSRTSSTPVLVSATHPAIAVISCGRANQFGFPAASVVERWSAAGADIARTDRDGTVTITVDADGGLEIDRFVDAAP
ncbi:MAG: ComEC/Rec2 family competence protein [Kofleriaceae bacterium]